MRFNSVISWILLAYFAFFIVPPASTFTASHQSRDAGVSAAECSLIQSPGQAPLLLFDVILWQSLKKAKHSEAFLALYPDDAGQGIPGSLSSDDIDLVQLASDPSGHVTIIGHVSLFHQSRSSSIRFARSGISPPAFSL
jgi:hypothetical protein